MRTLAGSLFSLACAAAVVWWMLKQDAPQWPPAENMPWLGVALGIDLLTYSLRGWRWHRIMRLGDVDHQTADALALTAVGYMGNNVLPARGGELLRIGLLRNRSHARKREILGSVLAERVLDAVVLVALFCLLTWLGVAGAPGGQTPAVIGGIVLAVSGAALAGYIVARRGGRFEDFAARIRPVAASSRVFIRPEGALMAAVSVVIWLLQGAAFLCIARALSLEMDALEATAVLVLGSVAALVPAAPGYVGTLDAGLGLGLSATGVTGGSAVAFILLVRNVMFVPVTIVGLVLLLVRYRDFRSVRERASVQGRARAEDHSPGVQSAR